MPFSQRRTDAQALARARSIQRRLQHGAHFATLARQTSDDLDSRAHSGQLPEMFAMDLRANMRPAVEALRPQSFSEPLLSSDGYHLVRLDEKTSPGFESSRRLLEFGLRGGWAPPSPRAPRWRNTPRPSARRKARATAASRIVAAGRSKRQWLAIATVALAVGAALGVLLSRTPPPLHGVSAGPGHRADAIASTPIAALSRLLHRAGGQGIFPGTGAPRTGRRPEPGRRLPRGTPLRRLPGAAGSRAASLADVADGRYAVDPSGAFAAARFRAEQEQRAAGYRPAMALTAQWLGLFDELNPEEERALRGQAAALWVRCCAARAADATARP